MAESFRRERDPLGDLEVPADAYYGVQTARAVANFPISGLRAPDDLIVATILIKKAAAEANMNTGQLAPDVGRAIMTAAGEVLEGQFRDQFIIDVYQAGAGTSHNMNANEVLANRAAELLGSAKGKYDKVHPNDHVNMSQSTNDVFPTATRLALLLGHAPLVDSARKLAAALNAKAREFSGVLKVGRTHLQDAVPITLGEEFSGYAACIDHAADDLDAASQALQELNLGATAVGTGLNASVQYAKAAIDFLRTYTNLDVKQAANLFRVTQSMGDVAAYSGAMRRLSIELGKIASDLRLLSMGPRAGLAEIILPAVQPGSSIMPGKINPSIPEMVNQVCFQVIGNDACVSASAEHGQLELNVMMPVIAHNVLFSMQILTTTAATLTERCVKGIEANAEQCAYWVERSAALATALAPQIGYARAAEISKQSVKENVLIRDLVKREHVLPDAEIDEVLDLRKLTEIGVPGGKHGGVSAG